MTVRFFADTWFFVALLDRFDAHARVVERLFTRYHAGLVTHDGVLIEILAYFSGHGSAVRAKAARAVREAALNLTVVDRMSMIVMRERGVTHVITNDRHFEQEGFVLVNQ